MMKDKKSKIMLGVIIGLVLVIGVLTAVIISLSGKKDDKTGNDDTVPSVSTEAATESARMRGKILHQRRARKRLRRMWRCCIMPAFRTILHGRKTVRTPQPRM